MTTKLSFWLWEGLESKRVEPYLIGIYAYFFKTSISLYFEGLSFLSIH